MPSRRPPCRRLRHESSNNRKPGPAENFSRVSSSKSARDFSHFPNSSTASRPRSSSSASWASSIVASISSRRDFREENASILCFRGFTSAISARAAFWSSQKSGALMRSSNSATRFCMPSRSKIAPELGKTAVQSSRVERREICSDMGIHAREPTMNQTSGKGQNAVPSSHPAP